MNGPTASNWRGRCGGWSRHREREPPDGRHEERLDHVVTRISGLEANIAEALLMLRRLTTKGDAS